ncbi:hypothetical protein ACOSQ2_008851 [Xanthoceras sorbifolium]|uniref:Copper transport protein n=1 Tax=Xanthoceras sorbifolium TaxID=99658 RepID=A0ABQ8ICU5_9ROSI|nr:hypothetical protein JRO89_XS03G0300100 [Xanthoceras sorbifolium]
MMHMTFYWGRQVTLLFDSWKTQSWTAYALTLLACFFVSAFYQFLEDRRILLIRLGSTKTTGIEAPLLQRKVAGKYSAARIAGTVMFGVNSSLGYLLMLTIMSFNGGVFLAIVLGLTVGYLVFRAGNEEVAVVVDNPCACA